VAVKTEADSPSAPPIALSARRPVSNTLLRYWLPVVLWMALIFGFSTDAGAPRNSSRIIGPLLRWLDPEISDATVQAIQLAVRKTAHVTEYAILVLLVWRARRQPVRGDSRPWRWNDAVVAFVVAALFAASDEWHQSFVPSREGQWSDVAIDSVGAAMGLTAWWAWGRWRQRW
jgi:VanZ family protein